MTITPFREEAQIRFERAQKRLAESIAGLSSSRLISAVRSIHRSGIIGNSVRMDVWNEVAHWDHVSAYLVMEHISKSERRQKSSSGINQEIAGFAAGAWHEVYSLLDQDQDQDQEPDPDQLLVRHLVGVLRLKDARIADHRSPWSVYEPRDGAVLVWSLKGWYRIPLTSILDLCLALISVANDEIWSVVIGYGAALPAESHQSVGFPGMRIS